MDQERTYQLLTRWLSGEASPEEQRELEELFLANPELRRMAELLSELRSAPPQGVSAQEEQRMMDRGWERLLRNGADEAEQPSKVLALPVVRKIEEEELSMARNTGEAEPPVVRKLGEEPVVVGRKPRWAWVAAASALVVLVAGGWLYSRMRQAPVAGRSQPVAILAAGRGARKSAQLPDGTKLWLNAGSRIVLAAGFSHNKRELTLEGEAYFDVKHDEQFPFIIHTGAVEVRVLGTELNVRAYPGDPSIEATLIEGKAEIGLAGNPQSAILLHPNEKVIIPNEAAALAPGERAGTDSTKDIRETGLPVRYERRPIVPDQTDGTIAETSWTSNKLVFRNETLGAIGSRLERWYDVKIIFDDNRYQQDTISGTFPNIPVGNVMHALQLTEKFQYRIARDTIHIW
jgi:transmembrane sensor